MARTKANASPDALGNTQQIQKAQELPRFQLSEMGQTGLRVAAGVPIEELKRELQFPQSIVTYKQMSYHSSIAAAIALYDMMIAKVDWHVEAPEKATDDEKRKTEFIRECMQDMDHTWMEFVQEAGSMKTFGFSVHEKVFRKRLKSKGSKYNDGLIGWKKLPVRSQDTIDRWYFDDETRELTGVRQNLSSLNTEAYGYSLLKNGTEIILPRNKFLLFRTGKHKGNPFGRSCLRDCFYSWKYLTSIEETEAVGIQRDLSGLPVLSIPPQYMTADATPEQKAIYAHYMTIIRNIQMNQQAGLIIPQAFDPDSKQPLFKFELMGVNGGKTYDTTKIKDYYKNSILTTLFADLLILGQGSTGSYALGSIKSNLMAVAIEALLREMVDVINNDLIKHTFELNGWDTTRLPKVCYDDFTEENLEEFSKGIQRMAAVNFIEKDREVLNKIRESLGVAPFPEDDPVHYDLLTDNQTKSGQGMKEGLPGGTGQAIGSSGDASANNADNAA